MEVGGSILPDIEDQQLAEGQEDGEGRREVYTLPLATFNVDSLSHFKPVLCVENGFVTQTDGDLKATHIVIQQAQGTPPAAAPPGRCESWTDAINSPVIPIRCKNTSGELHKAKFGSGGRGRCILKGKSWYTPIEFEAACGRGSSKDWKRSLRYGGHSIQTLIDERIINPHATSCTCATCCDDTSATGPVRYFVPYRRKRRNNNSDSDDKGKSKRDGSADESESEPTPAKLKKEEAWQNLTNGLDTNDDVPLLEAVEAVKTAETTEPINFAKKLDELYEKAAKHYGEFRSCMDEMKSLASKIQKKEKEDKRTEAAAHPIITVEPHMQLTAIQTSENSAFKRCANCNREASAECSLCRQTSYCSIFCQKKDWTAHQIECMRVTHSEHQGQSIMLIVENAAE